MKWILYFVLAFAAALCSGQMTVVAPTQWRWAAGAAFSLSAFFFAVIFLGQ